MVDSKDASGVGHEVRGTSCQFTKRARIVSSGERPARNIAVPAPRRRLSVRLAQSMPAATGASDMKMKLEDLPPNMLAQAQAQLGYKPITGPEPIESDDGKQSGLEKDLQRLCEQELSRRGIWYLHLSPRAREKAGVPDLIFCAPAVVECTDCMFGKAWAPWAVELKTPAGKVSPEQRKTLADMETNGWRTAVVRSYEEFRNVVFGEPGT